MHLRAFDQHREWMDQRSGDRAGRAPPPRPPGAARGMVINGVQHYKHVKGLARALLEFEAFCARIGKQSHILDQLDRGARELLQAGPEMLAASSLK
eukprot:2608576-Pyramimonas_sp.AAC.1